VPHLTSMNFNERPDIYLEVNSSSYRSPLNDLAFSEDVYRTLKCSLSVGTQYPILAPYDVARYKFQWERNIFLPRCLVPTRTTLRVRPHVPSYASRVGFRWSSRFGMPPAWSSKTLTLLWQLFTLTLDNASVKNKVTKDMCDVLGDQMFFRDEHITSRNSSFRDVSCVTFCNFVVEHTSSMTKILASS
jgi:hypothetical protein